MSEMETDQQHAADEAAKHGNALQEINANPTPINEISEPSQALDTHNDDENSQPIGPDEDGIKYSENVVPADEDENSDQENLKPTLAEVGVELQEKKKRKKKSKSKRGLVTSEMVLDKYWANVDRDAIGKADGLRGVLR